MCANEGLTVHIAATPTAHFGQPPAPYGQPSMSPYAQIPQGMPPQSAGGFGRGGPSPAGYMAAPQHGGYGASAYGGYQG